MSLERENSLWTNRYLDKVPNACIFCQSRKASTKEDWPPRWTKPFNSSLNLEHAVSSGSGPVNKGYFHQKGAKSKGIKVVCGTCNNGWMSVLQEKTKNILFPKPMASNLDKEYGFPTSLSGEHIEVLRQWALMTVAIQEQSHPSTRCLDENDLGSGPIKSLALGAIG